MSLGPEKVTAQGHRSSELHLRNRNDFLCTHLSSFVARSGFPSEARDVGPWAAEKATADLRFRIQSPPHRAAPMEASSNPAISPESEPLAHAGALV